MPALKGLHSNQIGVYGIVYLCKPNSCLRDCILAKQMYEGLYSNQTGV